MTYTVVVPVTIEPLSKIPASSLRDFLIRHQHESAIIDWKYFDERFNAGRERGFACVDQGRVVSFLGLIPFTAVQNGKRVPAAWSCDWHRDSDAPGPLGVMLIRQSLKAYPFIYSSGGSEMTTAIMSRLSTLTVPPSGIELYKPLRVGGLLYLLQRAARLTHLRSFNAIGNAKLPRIRRQADQEISTTLFDSISPSLSPFLNPSSPGTDFPAYDLSHLRWLLQDCPSISGGVCLISRSAEPIGAICFWHLKEDRKVWRLSVVSAVQNYSALGAGFERVVSHITDNGGQFVSLMASRLDKNLLQLAKRLGFYQSNTRRPLYILAREPNSELAEMQGLTYLDTDYAYRFPTTTE